MTKSSATQRVMQNHQDTVLQVKSPASQARHNTNPSSTIQETQHPIPRPEAPPIHPLPNSKETTHNKPISLHPPIPYPETPKKQRDKHQHLQTHLTKTHYSTSRLICNTAHDLSSAADRPEPNMKLSKWKTSTPRNHPKLPNTLALRYTKKPSKISPNP